MQFSEDQAEAYDKIAQILLKSGVDLANGIVGPGGAGGVSSIVGASGSGAGGAAGGGAGGAGAAGAAMVAPQVLHLSLFPANRDGTRSERAPQPEQLTVRKGPSAIQPAWRRH